MSALLDVLVTQSSDTPKAFIEQCMASVNAAVKAAGYPVNVIVVPGVPGHVGQAMMNGLKLSAANYVCWVDDDDWVQPRAFAILAPALRKTPVTVCAREMQFFKNGHERPFNQRHHLTAWQSTWIKAQDLSPFKATPLVYLMKRLPADVIDVMDYVYMRRMRLSPAMKLRGLHTRAESKLWT